MTLNISRNVSRTLTSEKVSSRPVPLVFSCVYSRNANVFSRLQMVGQLLISGLNCIFGSSCVVMVQISLLFMVVFRNISVMVSGWNVCVITPFSVSRKMYMKTVRASEQRMNGQASSC